MSQSPHQKLGSKRYEDAWRAINVLIRSDGSWSGRERNTAYLNSGDGRFRDVSFVSGADFPVDGRAFVVLDIDHDGDLDLALKSRNSPQIQILRNDLPSRSAGKAASITIQLSGSTSNRDAVGAKAILHTSERRLLRTVRSGSGFLSQSSRRIHFGLAADERPLRLEIIWPGGSRQEHRGIHVGDLLHVAQGRSQPEKMTPGKPAAIVPRSLPSRQLNGTWLLEPFPAPDFSLPDLSGRRHRLSGYRGKKVLLNLWATWCPPCRRELAEITAQAQRFDSEGIEVLALSVDEADAHDQVRSFAQGLNIPFPVLLDEGKVAATYSIIYKHLYDRWRDLPIPTSFLLDERGHIIKVYTGATTAETILADSRSGDRDALPFQGTWHLRPPGRNYVEMATALAEHGLRSQAASLFAAALEAGRSDPELYHNYGVLLFEEGEAGRAEVFLRKSLEMDPQDYQKRLNLGLLIAEREPQQALTLLLPISETRPDDALVHSTLGAIFFRLGDLESAERRYRRCVQLESSLAEHHFNLGSVLASAGRFEEALPYLEQARELGLSGVQLLNSIGILYIETAQLEKGRAALAEALRLDPQHYESYVNLALYFFRIGQPEQALIWIEKAAELEPDRAEAPALKSEILKVLP